MSLQASAESVPFIQGCTGFPCANFSLAGEITPQGEVFPRILYNPPVLGPWLEEWGRGSLRLEFAGRRWSAADCRQRQVRRAWPQAQVTWADADLPVKLRLDTLAPVTAGDVATTALPVLVAQFHLDGVAGKTATLEFDLERTADLSASLQTTGDQTSRLDYFPDFGLGWDQLEKGDQVTFQRLDARRVRARATVALAPGRRLVLYVLVWHDNALAACHGDLPSLFHYVRRERDRLGRDAAALSEKLPVTGDSKIDTYARWYMVPAMILTRVLKDSTILTMGYCEFNQRDSFWTSFPHLFYWPDAERRMLQESAAAMRPNGKVPTCILPIIEHEDDIDINCYFLLRVSRYHNRYQDQAFLKTLWPACVRALEYLLGRCPQGSCLPAQGSFWADWKDVDRVNGRVYAPHFCLLYLAALHEMIQMACALDEQALADHWTLAYEAGHRQVNLPVAEGGLWNGKCYVEIWKDGLQDDRVLEDQMVGGVWGVIPRERLLSIVEALKPNEQPWGVRETFPYNKAIEGVFCYEDGDYHNGAVWPWLNAADAMARLRYGLRPAALRLLRAVGEWDLEKHGDYLAHENLHGEDGRNIRRYIQGWNAAYVAAAAHLAAK
ncbi:MAG: GH116 family glycosyl hydrolase [Kiritimatiellia bacterium]